MKKLEKKANGPTPMEKFTQAIKQEDVPRLVKMRGQYEDARALTAGRGDIKGANKAQNMIDIINEEIRSRK